MEATSLLRLCDGLQIERISETPTTVVVTVLSSSTKARCPLCTQVSSRIHSRYTRRVADLPCAGRHVTLLLTLHKFWCQNPACSRQIFAERVSDLVSYYARATNRLSDALEALGFATSAEMVAGLAPRLGIQTTPTTMLRRLRAVPCEFTGTVRVLGVDDFAWKKGQTYGTILVNLEAHQVSDLLPDREAETLVAWLRAHPGVEIVSRDRASTYADAATRGAPQAIQVADRFHLLKNLREKLADLLKRKHPCLPVVAEARADGIPKTAQGQMHKGSARSTPPCPESPPDAALPSTLPRGSPSFPANERRKQERRTSRYARYEEVLALHRQGLSEHEIAQTLGLCRNTVHRFLTAEGYPELSDWPKRGSLLDAYKPYLLERVQHGCWHGEQLYQEIKERGYGGSESLLRLFLADLRRRQRGTPASPMRTAENDARLAPAGAAPPEQPLHRRLSASRASWLFVRPPEQLDELQRVQLDQIRLAHPDLETAYQLSQSFVSMVTQRRHTELDSWLTRAAHCGLAEFTGFARSLRRLFASVESGAGGGAGESLKVAKTTHVWQGPLRLIAAACSSPHLSSPFLSPLPFFDPSHSTSWNCFFRHKASRHT